MKCKSLNNQISTIKTFTRKKKKKKQKKELKQNGNKIVDYPKQGRTKIKGLCFGFTEIRWEDLVG